VFEINRKAGAVESQPCPSCGGPTKRVFTPVGVVFKGSGFHNTDYRPKTTDTSESTEKPAPCGSSGESSACKTCPASSSNTTV
jgi:predicted nucleic acid-binding Zn ribbon protein